MKKHPLSWLAPFAIVLIISVLRTDVYAHPGKTDSNGGHTNHSTGEYHYHHGYSAHDHYDVDGDGDVDCPYDFDNRTGANSGGASDRSGISSRKSYNSNTGQTATKNVNTDESEVEEVPVWVYWVFGGLATVIICLLISNRSKKDTISEMERQHKNKITEINKACETRIAEKNASDAELETIRTNIADARKIQTALLVEQADCLNKISHLNKEILKLRRVRCWAKAAPLDVSFSKNGMPVYWRHRSDKPYGDYTVFVSSKTDIYHTDRFCGGYRAREEHIFNVIDHTSPCKKCAEGFFDFTSVPDWFTAERAALETNNPAVPPDDPNIKVNYR